MSSDWSLDVAIAPAGAMAQIASAINRPKKRAFGVMIDRVKVAQVAVDPKDLFETFTPPQSFLYLNPLDFQRVMRAMFPNEEHA